MYDSSFGRLNIRRCGGLDSREIESVILNASTHSSRIKFIHLCSGALGMRFGFLALLCASLIVCSCAKKKPAEATHIGVTMRRFAIEPEVIRVKQGENVVLDVSSKDVQHGFGVEQLGINEPIQPGKPAHITLDTSKKGEFDVACSIICGPGHNDMTAKIVVE